MMKCAYVYFNCSLMYILHMATVWIIFLISILQMTLGAAELTRVFSLYDVSR